jgi:hypothetical protein
VSWRRLPATVGMCRVRLLTEMVRELCRCLSGHTHKFVGGGDHAASCRDRFASWASQLNDKGISFLSETEPERALRAREELLTALQGCNVSIGMTHFPGLGFQRIMTANGREWTTAG